MQVTPNQNIQKPAAAPQQNVNGTTTQPVCQQNVQQPCTPGYIPPQVPYYPPCYSQPQVQNQPQQQGQAQPQNVQVPATAAGVNIQIFNPSVGTPGSPAPTYNVNAPCYPSGYYTNSLGQDGKMHPNNTCCNCPPTGTGNTGSNVTTETTTNTNNTNNKKTEKRKIVELNDDYIRMLESYLNSQDEKIRLNAAKDVYARLEEDDSRHDDKALTALVNKMLQDPSDEIRLLALTALEGRMVDGDDYTVNVLKKMQQSDGGYGQDAVEANKILLQMSSRQVEKEFEVKDKPKTETTKTTSTQTTESK